MGELWNRRAQRLCQGCPARRGRTTVPALTPFNWGPSSCLGDSAVVTQTLAPAPNEPAILQQTTCILPKKKLKVTTMRPSLLTLECTWGVLFHFCHLTYIVEREGCFVDPGAYELVNPKLFDIVPYLIHDPGEDEVNLKRFQNRKCGSYSESNHCFLLFCRHLAFRFCFLGSF